MLISSQGMGGGEAKLALCGPAQQCSWVGGCPREQSTHTYTASSLICKEAWLGAQQGGSCLWGPHTAWPCWGELEGQRRARGLEDRRPGQPELARARAGKRMPSITVYMCDFSCKSPVVSSQKGECNLILAAGFRGRVDDIQ